MQVSLWKLGIIFLAFTVGLSLQVVTRGQETPANQPAQTPAGQLPSTPKGVEVLARGPVHEAFATPTTEPVPTQPVSKRPPKPLEEMPPDTKPEGNVIWVGGYWAWDDDRKDFLWVSGIWRTQPPGKRWVAGYWKENGEQWLWVPGFWAVEQQENTAQQVTYLPAPPAPPEVASPGQPPTADSFYVPGSWAWHDAGYATIGGSQVWREAGYSWSAGYWARVQPGYVWVPAHYRWTPGGYIYVAGYWDFAIAQRGVLYAPVVVDPVVVGPTFVYTPAYAVSDTILIDAMFVRPCYCHYYFGDYYGATYTSLGFESCIVYSRRCYDPIFVYARWEHRADPTWESVQIDICLGRNAGQIACPPRTLVQQNTIVQQNITNVTNVTNNNTTSVVNNTTTNNNNITNNNKRTTVNNSQVLMPASQLAAVKGMRTVPLDSSTRLQAKQQAQSIQQVAMQRSQTEVPVPAGKTMQPRAATLNVPPAQPVLTRQEAASMKAASTATPRGTSPGAAANSHANAPAGASRPAGVGVPAYPGANSQGLHANQPGQRPPGVGTPNRPGQLQRLLPTNPPRPPQRPVPSKPDSEKHRPANDQH